MSTSSRSIPVAVSLAILILLLGSCSGLADLMGLKDGEDGAAGPEGPNLYLEDVATGERIYSGGSVYLGLITSGTTTSTYAVVNKTGDSLTLTGTPYYLVGGSSRQTTYDGVTSTYSGAITADDSGLTGVLASGASTGNELTLTLDYTQAPNAVTYKRFTLPLHDGTTGEDIVLSFEAYGMCGS